MCLKLYALIYIVLKVLCLDELWHDKNWTSFWHKSSLRAFKMVELWQDGLLCVSWYCTSFTHPWWWCFQTFCYFHLKNWGKMIAQFWWTYVFNWGGQKSPSRHRPLSDRVKEHLDALQAFYDQHNLSRPYRGWQQGKWGDKSGWE